MDDQNPRVIQNLDEWASRLAVQLERECVSIPDSVVALAAIRLLGKAVRRSTVLTPTAALTLAGGELEDKETITA